MKIKIIFFSLIILLCYSNLSIAQKTICYSTEEKTNDFWKRNVYFALQVQNDTILKLIKDSDSNIYKYYDSVTPVLIHEYYDQGEYIYKSVSFNDLFRIFEHNFINFEHNYQNLGFNPEKESSSITCILLFIHTLRKDLKDSLIFYIWEKYKLIDYGAINDLKDDFNPKVYNLIQRDLHNLDHYFYLINATHGQNDNYNYFIDSLLDIRYDYSEKYNKVNFLQTMEYVIKNISDSNLYTTTIDYLYEHYYKAYNQVLLTKLESLSENQVISTIEL